MDQKQFKSRYEDKLKVQVGDIFVPKVFDQWADASYVVVGFPSRKNISRGPAVMRIGGRRSGEVSFMGTVWLQRSYWASDYIRF